jgi:hypothetical protein
VKRVQVRLLLLTFSLIECRVWGKSQASNAAIAVFKQFKLLARYLTLPLVRAGPLMEYKFMQMGTRV